MSGYQSSPRSFWMIETSPVWSKTVGQVSGDVVMLWKSKDDYHAKQGRSTCRTIIGTESLPIYLKRHWQLPWTQRLQARWRPESSWSPAAIEWNNLHWARDNGFLVPEPLAMGQAVGPGLNVQSFLAIRELSGMLPLHQAVPQAYGLLNGSAFQRWKQKLIEIIGQTTRRLHQTGRYHKDLYLCHFYVPAPSSMVDDPGPVALIDLHRMGYHRWSKLRWQIKDLAQLYFSTLGVAGLEASDRHELMCVYFESHRWNIAQKMLFRAIEVKAKRYARHNQTSHIAIEPSHEKATRHKGQAA